MQQRNFFVRYFIISRVKLFYWKWKNQLMNLSLYLMNFIAFYCSTTFWNFGWLSWYDRYCNRASINIVISHIIKFLLTLKYWHLHPPWTHHEECGRPRPSSVPPFAGSGKWTRTAFVPPSGSACSASCERCSWWSWLCNPARRWSTAPRKFYTRSRIHLRSCLKRDKHIFFCPNDIWIFILIAHFLNYNVKGRFKDIIWLNRSELLVQ